MPTIVLTGGGTAGACDTQYCAVARFARCWIRCALYRYADGIERELIAREGIPYYAVPAGKLRRYLDWQNFTDLARIKFGFLKSLLLLTRIRPDIL